MSSKLQNWMNSNALKKREQHTQLCSLFMYNLLCTYTQIVFTLKWDLSSALKKNQKRTKYDRKNAQKNVEMIPQIQLISFLESIFSKWFSMNSLSIGRKLAPRYFEKIFSQFVECNLAHEKSLKGLHLGCSTSTSRFVCT